jgi:hypothetical protein
MFSAYTDVTRWERTDETSNGPGLRGAKAGNAAARKARAARKAAE